MILAVAMCTRLPTTPSPRATVSGTTHYNSTAHKAGRAVGTAWMISQVRVSKLTALVWHYGKLEELAVGSVLDEAAAADETVKAAIGPTGTARTSRIVKEVGIGHCWREPKEVRRVTANRLERLRQSLREERTRSHSLQVAASNTLTKDSFEKWRDKIVHRSRIVYHRETNKGTKRQKHQVARMEDCRKHIACRRMRKHVKKILRNQEVIKRRAETEKIKEEKEHEEHTDQGHEVYKSSVQEECLKIQADRWVSIETKSMKSIKAL